MTFSDSPRSTTTMKKQLLWLLVLLGCSLAVHAKPANGLHDTANEYWRTLRVALDGFFVPENKLLQLRFFDGRVPTPAEVERKKTEVITLAELAISDLASLAEKPAAKRLEELNLTLGFLCELSFWGIAGSDAEQQLKINRAFSRLWRTADEERTKIIQASRPVP